MGQGVKVGLIGAGRIGRVHGRHLARAVDGAELTLIADLDRARAETLADELRCARATDELDEVWTDREIDAVVIAAPSTTHAELIERSAGAGKHVFCEKPIDLDLACIDSVLAKVTSAGVLLQVGFNRRFDPNFRRCRDELAAGTVGRVERVHITSRDTAPPPLDYLRGSGGLFFDMAIHDVDMAGFLLDEVPVEVFATGSAIIEPEIGTLGDVDTAVTILRYASGALVTIDNSRRSAYGHDQRVEVFGSAGMLSVANQAPHGVCVIDPSGKRAPWGVFDQIERYIDSYRLEMQHFVDGVRTGSTPEVGGFAARQATLLARAASQSLRERQWIKIENR